jgi:hypothetical protein
VAFSGYSGSFINKTDRHNIVESGVKHPNPNPIQGIYHVTSYYYNNISYLYIFFTSFFFKMSVSECCLTPIEQFLNISW